LSYAAIDFYNRVANIEQKSKMKKLIKTSPEMAYSGCFHKKITTGSAQSNLYAHIY